MATSKVPVTYAFGRRDRVDPKLAPLGVLDVGKNLRVRKDGRLGTRNGFQPLSMTTANGTLEAFDVHEYRGRLCALGSDADDGFPTDRFEYLGIAPNAWKGSDRYGQRATLSPFSGLREVAGIPQPANGTRLLDAAAGGGFVCLIYTPVGTGAGYGNLYALIVDAATDQPIHAEVLTGAGGVLAPLGLSGVEKARVTFAGGTFYVAGTSRLTTNYLRIAQFTPGASGAFSVFADPRASVGTGFTVFAIDIVPVANPTTARVAFVMQFTGETIRILIYSAAGTQIGSTIAVTSASVSQLALEADQVDDTVNLFSIESTNVCKLRTYAFAGTLLDGPTTLTSGESGSICRLPARGAQAESVAVAINTPTFGVSVTVYNQDTHAAGTPFVVQQALLRTRLVCGQSTGQVTAVVFGGLVAPVLPDDDQATNVLFYATPTVVHAAFRDYVRARDTNLVNLTLDSSTGSLCWPSLFDPGADDVQMPVVSLVEFQSTARRQGVPFGALYYEAGAPVSVYDGRFSAELGFGEAPGIISATPSNSATYESTASMTGTVVEPGIVRSSGKTLVFSVDNAGSETTVTVAIAFSAPLAVIATFISSVGSGTITASVVDGKLRVATVASGADVSITLTGGTMAEMVGLARFVGRTVYGSTALIPGATYYYTLHFEHVLADKSLMLGPPSVGGAAGDDFSRAQSATLTGDQNIITLVVTTPHSLRVAMADALYGGDITAVLSRTVWQPTASIAGVEVNGAADSIFRRCVVQRVPLGMAHYGETLTFVDHVSDEDLADNEALYTQADRGALSGPLEQNAARVCRYITATESRLITGGLGSEFLAQVSREAFTSEAISFSDFSQFFSQVAGPIIGVHALDSARFVFTEDRIYAITGAGPDDIGGAGFDPPVEIPTPSGLSNAWSFLEGPDGLWFQLDDSKLFRIPRGGGAPTWEGIDIEDTLLAYPTITGACKHKGDNVAVFACSDAEGDARFLVRDFRTENWFEDAPVILGEETLGVVAITSYGDTLAYITRGTVYVQTTGFIDGASDFIGTQARTHPLYPFGVGGYGQIYELLLTGEYRGDCQLACRVSYDDGLTFTELDSFELVRLTVGETVQRKWTLPQDITSSLVIELSCLQSEDDAADATSEGFVFNQVDLLVEAEDGLRELEPSEMA